MRFIVALGLLLATATFAASAKHEKRVEGWKCVLWMVNFRDECNIKGGNPYIGCDAAAKGYACLKDPGCKKFYPDCIITNYAGSDTKEESSTNLVVKSTGPDFDSPSVANIDAISGVDPSHAVPANPREGSIDSCCGGYESCLGACGKGLSSCFRKCNSFVCKENPKCASALQYCRTTSKRRDTVDTINTAGTALYVCSEAYISCNNNCLKNGGPTDACDLSCKQKLCNKEPNCYGYWPECIKFPRPPKRSPLESASLVEADD